MSVNPLVAGPVDTTTATSGTFLLDDVVTLASAIQEGNWVDAALAGFSTAMDGLSAAIDPLGSLFAMGIGWVLDHIWPLNEWLNDLTGDAGAVLGFSQTWHNIGDALAAEALAYANAVTSDLSGMHGSGIAAYQQRAADLVTVTAGAGRAAAGISGGLKLASTLVQFVHDLVRDAISEFVGGLGSAAAWAATGVGMPYAITIVSDRAAAFAARLSGKISALLRSIRGLDTLLRSLDTVLREVDDAIRSLVRGGPGGHGPGVPGPRPDGELPGPRPDGGPGPNSTPDGTQPSGPGRPFDPDESAPETIPAKDAPRRYTQDDVQDALDNAPVDANGRPVDPRTGEPLVLQRSDGQRGWEMRWDPDRGEWVAQNFGSGHPDGMPAHGDSGGFGYDANGDLMPYANHRPSYAPGQVERVWANMDPDGDGIVYVLDRNDDLVPIQWQPGQPRDGVWDMGHIPDEPYRDLRHAYLNHEITLEEFLARYQDPDNYRVEHPGRNRSHVDEVP